MGEKSNVLMGCGEAYMKKIEESEKKKTNEKEMNEKITSSDKTKKEKNTEPVKAKEEKSVVIRKAEKEEKKEAKVIRGTKLFSLATPGIIRPKRAKRGQGGKFKYLSVYLPVEEIEMVEELADKYGMTTSNYVRTLIINSD